MPAQTQTDPLTILRAYLAATCIGHSTLRNQGAKGVIQTARDYLAALDLNRFRRASDHSSYLEILDAITSELQSALPSGARHFGAARKSINLFLRETCYCHTVRNEYDLARLEKFMEIPLDSLVASALRTYPGGQVLDPWPGLKRLTWQTNATYQTFAREHVANTGETLPALDMRLWLIATEKVRAKAKQIP